MRVTTLNCGFHGDIGAGLKAVEAAFLQVPEAVTEPHMFRLEAHVSGDLSVADALQWSMCTPADSRAFWADRSDEVVVAGIGEAWTLGGLGWTVGDGLESLQRLMAPAPKRLRAFGGLCFHRELRSSGAWKAFGAWRFAVPRVELGRDGGGVWLAAHVQGSPKDWTRRLAEARAVITRLLLAEPVDHHGASTQPEVNYQSIEDVPNLDDWREAVRAALAKIESTSLQKVVLARQRRVDLTTAPDPLALLARLAAHEPDAFRFCLQPTAESAFVGASPERLIRVQGQHVTSEALAGTRPRSSDLAQDSAWTAELLASEKDRREHRLVADMVTETLTELCEKVEPHGEPTVMALANVQHLHSRIEARTNGVPSIASLLLALHPTPAVGGTPRAAARSAIETLEGFQRGLYAAPVGWIGGAGTAEFTVAIRSALVERDAISLFSGAGIVAGSDPDAEWSEIDGKIAALWLAFGLGRGER